MAQLSALLSWREQETGTSESEGPSLGHGAAQDEEPAGEVCPQKPASTWQM